MNFQTSRSGDKLKEVSSLKKSAELQIRLFPDSSYQRIEGFGGAFTESSAYLLNQISKENRDSILTAYFGSTGSNYSLCRTHMNSCDFSLKPYSYTPVANDTLLTNFSVSEDEEDLIPMIRDAMEISNEGFKLIASPWTAPPWMKDNNEWFGGKLKPEFYDSWALFFSKYASSYKAYGIDIWAFTVENEPLGNNSNWESMHFSPEEMGVFVKDHLGPQLKENHPEIKTLVYDQNRGEELEEWSEQLLNDKEASPYIYGTAVHWYNSTYDYFPESLQFTHQQDPSKHIIETEGCIDAEVPHWQDDDWYWQKEATDWGFQWAKPENKHRHPKYVPTFRYARDMIGCLNNWVEGWIDWNMVLDDRGGPNHAENWCIAPILVKPEKDEIYITPLYYVIRHFSHFIRPGANRIHFELNKEDLMVTAAKNPNGDLILVILNMEEKANQYEILLGNSSTTYQIAASALQTVLIKKNQ